jgi:DNA-binding NarL/FixJ family response regulator
MVIEIESARRVAVLVLALEEVLQAAGRLLDTLADTVARDSEAARRQAPCRSSSNLSPREMEVLRLLAAGHSNQRIAQTLFLSPRTVQRHIANIYPKLGVHCRAEAIIHALHHGLADFNREPLA